MESEAENNKSAEGVYIPEDIIRDILLRLPVKPLARFRCVSKAWLFLISSYNFSKAQLKFSRKNSLFNDKLIFGYNTIPLEFYTCSIKSIITEGSNSGFDQVYPETNDNLVFDRTEFNCPFVVGEIDGKMLLSSCNGLFCVLLEPNTVYLWNPTTRESKKIAHSGTHSKENDCFSFAFGYDELHDDYKVLEFLWRDPAPEPSLGVDQVKLYSLRTNTWKILSNWPGGYFFDFHGTLGTFCNGAVHWLVGDDECVIVSYDLAMDTFTEFALPTLDDDVLVEVDTLQGHLALCCEHDTHVEVWLMQEYGVSKSWAKAVQISFLPFMSNHPIPRPLFLFEDGKVLVNYGISLGIFEQNKPQSHQSSSTFSFEGLEATTYFESLVSPSLDNKVFFGRMMPPEIITEILLRLPVKPLVRFKSVSKGWLSLISSSSFVKAHLKTSSTKNNVKLIFGPTAIGEGLYTCSINSMIERPALTETVFSVGDQNPTFDLVLFDSPVAPDAPAEIRFLGSCNGLVCLTLSRNIILVNPATRKSRILPNSSADDNKREYYAFSYSFGYDEVHDDYKVVEFISFEHDPFVIETFVEVYSMRTNSWKALSNWPGGDTCGWLGKYLNGSIHWLVLDLPDDGLAKRVIVSHDLATDTFVQLPLPNNPDVGGAKYVEIIVLGGCLALYCAHHNNMDVWMMKEYGVRESWTRVVRTPFFMDLEYFATPCPMFMWEDGKILMNYGLSLKIYDSRNPQPHQLEPDSEVVAETYVESLVSLTLDEDMIN